MFLCVWMFHSGRGRIRTCVSSHGFPSDGSYLYCYLHITTLTISRPKKVRRTALECRTISLFILSFWQFTYVCNTLPYVPRQLPRRHHIHLIKLLVLPTLNLTCMKKLVWLSPPISSSPYLVRYTLFQLLFS